jgi:hypothetical protein
MFSEETTTGMDMAEIDSLPTDALRIETLQIEELVDELATLAAHISAGMCRWLQLVGELDRRGSWAAWGHRSCAEWLSWRCSLAPRSAREHVRVAAALSGLPLVRAAFSRGRLSYAKVRALTRVGEPASEAELLDLATRLTASQLDRAVRAYRRVSAQEARVALEREELTWHWDDDGSLVLRGRLAPEDGALLLRSLEAARERLWRDARDEVRGSAEPREPSEPRRPTNVEALVTVADTALAHDAARTGGDRYQVVVQVDETALAADDHGACTVDDGPALAPETARRLACDASLVILRESAGTPLDVGRKTRSVPSSLRRALRSRDQGCRFPGCESRRFVDAHHIRHWASGGETALGNLMLLCRRHHRLVHEGGFKVDRFGRFFDPGGVRIPRVPPRPPGRFDAVREHNRGLRITPNTCSAGYADRMSLNLTVAGLLRIAARAPTAASGSGLLEPKLGPELNRDGEGLLGYPLRKRKEVFVGDP